MGIYMYLILLMKAEVACLGIRDTKFTISIYIPQDAHKYNMYDNSETDIGLCACKQYQASTVK